MTYHFCLLNRRAHQDEIPPFQSRGNAHLCLIAFPFIQWARCWREANAGHQRSFGRVTCFLVFFFLIFLFCLLGDANKGQVVVAVSTSEYLDGVGVVSVIAASASA
jgi:hypothetical protein